jgi:hypothetical protein
MHGTTIQFYPNEDGTVELTLAQTSDPNEECDSETFSAEEAEKKLADYFRQGYVRATYWHTCKRGMELDRNDD